MKRFLIKIAIYAAVLYGLAWGLDYIVSRGLYRMDDYRYMSWREIGEGTINADIVVIGNSRALSHFEPWTIDSITGMSCYNLGLGGYPINVDVMKYNFYRLHNTKPKLVILQADYLTLRCMSAPHQHQSEQFLPLVYDRDIRDELQRVGYSWIDRNIPMARYWGYQMVVMEGLSEYLGMKHHVDRPTRQGLFYETDPWNGAELAKMDTIHATMEEGGKAFLDQWMQECAAEDIKVLLINSPMYIGATNKTTGLEQVNAYFDSIASVYNTVYWDYTRDELCNDTTNFVVSVHMNPKATHKFSVNIANRLYKELKNEGNNRTHWVKN